MGMEIRLQHRTSTPKKMEFEYLKRITKQFSKELMIGSGGFGTVYKGKTDGGFVAVKKLRNIPGIQMDDKQFLNEVHVMGISHRNIVKLEGYCYHVVGEVMTTHDGKQILVNHVYRLLCFEYLPNGSLQKYLKDESHVDWNERYNIILGICNGLRYLHEGQGGAHILHLDLKPANILLDKDMTPKIADFGQSRLLFGEGQTHTANIIGTHGYMAPEYVDGGKLRKEADIYSLGVIIMEIVAVGTEYSRDDPVQFNEAVRGEWKRRLETTTSRDEHKQIEKCIEVALKCMEKDIRKRLDINQIIKILGISETMSPRPVEIEEHRFVNINSGEDEERVGLLHRPVADNQSSPLELESTTTPTRIQLPGMRKYFKIMSISIGVLCAILIGVCIDVAIFIKVIDAIMKQPMVSITVEEASLARFAMVTSPEPALTYNLTVTMSIYNPNFMALKITKPLEAAFFFSGQRFYIMQLANTGEMLSNTLLFRRGPLSGSVALGNAGVAEYRRETRTGLFQVELVLMGQVMHTDRYAICKLEATCMLKLRLELPVGMKAPTFQKVKCDVAKLDENC
ncbi:unnamed protein product [Urochloa humidicola]